TGPNHGQVVDAAGEVREQVGDLDAALPRLLKRPSGAEESGVLSDELVLGLAEFLGPGLPMELVQKRLGVECLQVARAASHEEEDDGARLGGMMGGPGRQRIDRPRAKLVRVEKRGECQAAEAA